jgi:hypothetical protein
VSADRSEKGDAHGVTAATLDDGWLIVQVVGAVVLRLSNSVPRGSLPGPCPIARLAPTNASVSGLLRGSGSGEATHTSTRMPFLPVARGLRDRLTRSRWCPSPSGPSVSPGRTCWNRCACVQPRTTVLLLALLLRLRRDPSLVRGANIRRIYGMTCLSDCPYGTAIYRSVPWLMAC